MTLQIEQKDRSYNCVALTHVVIFMLLSPWRKLRVRTTICVDLSYVVDAVHQVPVTPSHHVVGVKNCVENAKLTALGNIQIEAYSLLFVLNLE